MSDGEREGLTAELRAYYRAHAKPLQEALEKAVNASVRRRPATTDELIALVAQKLRQSGGSRAEASLRAVSASRLGSLTQLQAELYAAKQELVSARAALDELRGGSDAERMAHAASRLQARVRGKRSRRLAEALEESEKEKREAIAAARNGGRRKSCWGRQGDKAEAAWDAVEAALGDRASKPPQWDRGSHISDEGKLLTDARFFAFGHFADFLKGLFGTDAELGRSMEEEFKFNLGGKYLEEYRYVVHRLCEEDVDADGRGPLSSTTAKFRGKTSVTGKVIVRDEGHGGMCLADFAAHPDAVRAGLTLAEVAALRLYTGPTYRPLNEALRSRGGYEWRTTISCCTSAILKLSSLSHPERVYRGVREVETLLPPTFLEGEFAGGVEMGFTSTSRNPAVAIDYSGGAFTSGSLFVLDFDLGSRGAAIHFLSQYPAEEELLFPPCTGLSCTGYSIRGAKRLILLRPQVSTERPDTSEIITPVSIPGTRAALARVAALLAAPAEEAAASETWPLQGTNLSFLEAQEDLNLLLGRAQDQAPSLTSVDLSATSLGDDGAAVLASGLGMNRQLKTLNLGKCGMLQRGATALASALKVNTTLTTLDVSGCDANESPAVEEHELQIAAALGVDLSQRMRHESLSIIGGALLENPSSAVAHVTCDMFALVEGIANLRLDKDLISPGAATILAAAVRVNTSLKEVSVRHCPIEGTAADRLAAAALASKSLLEFSKVPLGELRAPLGGHTAAGKPPPSTTTTLRLFNAGLMPAGGVVAAGAAERSQRVSSLLIPFNKIGSEGGTAVVELVRKSQCLTHLDVRSNGIGGEVAEALAISVLANDRLAVFSELPVAQLRADSIGKVELIGLSLGVAEAIVLAKFVQTNRTLVEINLDRNNIGDEGGVAILRALGTSTCGVATARLYENGMGEPSGKAIIELIRTSKTLLDLNVGGNECFRSKDASDALADALEGNATLTKFLCLGAKLPPEAIERLRKVRLSREMGVHPPIEIKVG
jgi:Ran GTPase-activating protein (RanGAP) involved in mRNA processing and transport